MAKYLNKAIKSSEFGKHCKILISAFEHVVTATDVVPPNSVKS